VVTGYNTIQQSNDTNKCENKIKSNNNGNENNGTTKINNTSKNHQQQQNENKIITIIKSIHFFEKQERDTQFWLQELMRGHGCLSIFFSSSSKKVIANASLISGHLK
jgi:hypothetical protein